MFRAVFFCHHKTEWAPPRAVCSPTGYFFLLKCPCWLVKSPYGRFSKLRVPLNHPFTRRGHKYDTGSCCRIRPFFCPPRVSAVGHKPELQKWKQQGGEIYAESTGRNKGNEMQSEAEGKKSYHHPPPCPSKSMLFFRKVETCWHPNIVQRHCRGSRSNETINFDFGARGFLMGLGTFYVVGRNMQNGWTSDSGSFNI